MSSANVPGCIVSILKRVFGLTSLRRVSKRSSTRCLPVNRLMSRYAVARAAADTLRGGTIGRSVRVGCIAYFRLHGSTRMYWCFDNTASGAAIENAWELQSFVR